MSYLLYGQNGLMLDERIAALSAEIDPQNLSTTVIDVQTSSLGEITSACHAMPFFGGHRLVVLRNPIAMPKRGDAIDDEIEPEETTARIKWSDLHTIMRATPDTTLIIVRHDGTLTRTHYLVKAVQALGWKTESFATLFDDDLLAWIQQRVERAGLRIAPDTARQIAVLTYPTSWQGGRWVTDAPDLRLIASEVDKLCCAANDGVITSAIVDDLVADRSGFTSFHLNDQMFSGQTDKALRELDNVLASGEPAEKVLAQIAGESVAIATVKCSTGIPRDALTKASGISPGRLGGLQSKAAGLSQHNLARIAESIRGADAGVKAGLYTNTSATIVPLVADVTEVLRRENEGRRRN